MKHPFVPITPTQRRSVVIGALSAVLGIAACGDDAVSNIPPSDATTFNCDESAIPPELPLRRLSRVQYENTIADLVSLLSPDNSAAVLAEAYANVTLITDQKIGEDQHFARLSRLDQSVQQAHIDGMYRLGLAVGAALTSQTDRLTVAVGDCAVDNDPQNDVECVQALIRRLGERALRRPVTGEDVSFYSKHIDAPPYEPADYAEVIALLLNAPQLFYMVEHGSGPGDEAVAPLDAYEVASRLSYHFWQTMPDDELLAAAASGDLLSEAGYRTQVERIFNDPRTEKALRLFFDEWLRNTQLERLDSRVGTPAFDTLRGDFEPTASLQQEMWDEVTDSAIYYAKQGGSFRDFFQSDRSFARSEELAGLYGVSAWDGESEPPAWSSESRVGLLTRAAYIATGSAATRPIIKGVFIRKALLCDELGPPPPDAPTTVGNEGGSSTRARIENLTSPANCAVCHKTQINPLGFATENFDALGRERAEELLISAADGQLLGTVPVDTKVVPHVSTSDDREAAGAGDLSRFIVESPKPYACFSRLYFRFTFGREEDFGRDACALSAVKKSLEEDKPLGEVLLSVALTDAFRSRSFDQ